MRIAFYAPLKRPDHAVPSGERELARLFLRALALAGHEPFLAARLRSYDRSGDPRRQARLARLGNRLARRFCRTCRAAPPALWFTYHLYHKAPDWIGPAVADALGIPYVVAEASHARKQELGPWGLGHRAAAEAIRRADAVIGINPADRAGVLPLLADPVRWIPLPPFLDAAAFDPDPGGRRRAASGPVRLITVAMMREGDKLASYRLLGAALRRLPDLPWSLEIVGDGPARDAVAAALEGLGDRLRWAGELDTKAVAARLAAADLFVWPAIGEALGMALLEAQASGLPVVAGAAGGVGAIVISEVTGLLVPPGDAGAFAAATRRLIRDPEARARLGAAARRHVCREHDLPAAARRLAAVIDALAGAPSRPSRPGR
ncbi:MAG TPA: glycosyltransferase family 4 protein [Stellaceae bacterium]|nr:glycosyltransferase family 4 protein [Stellaceae bacterium]